jgi:hypothetical protein
MTNLERIAFAVCLLAGGVALGMYLEHERFLKELQGVAKKHADDPAPTKASQAEAVP